MLFTDIPAFPAFLFVVTLASALTRRSKALNQWTITAFSLIFFALYSLADFSLFIVFLVVNYQMLKAASALEGRARWRASVIIVAVDLAVMAYFKYYDFITLDVLHVKVLSALGPNGSRPLYSQAQYTGVADSVWLPLALSFYAFHAISYALDILGGKYRMSSFPDYLLYMCFFPHLIAGPIVRGNQLMPQIATPPRERPVDVAGGLYLFVGGLFLKVVTADNLSSLIDPYWTQAPAALAQVDRWLVAFMYSCQIFGDFAGYTYMALGIAKLLGYELPENFRGPYLARSFSEFWRRWHITLSSFLRDYLYIQALGGARVSRWRVYLNLMITMLLGGLWHGAAWHFVAWGAIHGTALCAERLLGLNENTASAARMLAWYLVVQLTVIVAWVFFRSPDIRFAADFVGGMFTGPGAAATHDLKLMTGLWFCLPVLAHHLAFLVPANAQRPGWPAAKGMLTGAMAVAVLVFNDGPRGFIYFNF